MADKKYIVRNERGAGVVFNDKKEADEFVKNNDGYALEDEAAEEKAVESAPENKAVKPAAKK